MTGKRGDGVQIETGTKTWVSPTLVSFKSAIMMEADETPPHPWALQPAA